MLATVGSGMLPLSLSPPTPAPLSRDEDLALALPSENFRLLAGDLERSADLVSDVLLVKSFLTFLINSGVCCSETGANVRWKFNI